MHLGALVSIWEMLALSWRFWEHFQTVVTYDISWFGTSLWEHLECLGVSGSIWELLEASGSSREHLQPPGSIWDLLEACGSLLMHLGASGIVWGYL